MEYIAFDAHKHYTLASVATPDGQLVREERIEHERGAVRQFLERCDRSRSDLVADPRQQNELAMEGPRHTPTAPPAAPRRPPRSRGETQGPHDETVDAQAGRIVMTAEEMQQGNPQPRRPSPRTDDGLGAGDEPLEIMKDEPTRCLDCRGRGWRYAGGAAREKDRCSLCNGSGYVYWPR